MEILRNAIDYIESLEDMVHGAAKLKPGGSSTPASLPPLPVGNPDPGPDSDPYLVSQTHFLRLFPLPLANPERRAKL